MEIIEIKDGRIVKTILPGMLEIEMTAGELSEEIIHIRAQKERQQAELAAAIEELDMQIEERLRIIDEIEK